MRDAGVSGASPMVLYDCEEDVRKTCELLRAMLRGQPKQPPVDLQRTLHWSNYSAKAVAKIGARHADPHGKPGTSSRRTSRASSPNYCGGSIRMNGTEHPIYTPEGESTWRALRTGYWLPECAPGRGWRAANSTSAAMPSG